MTPYQLMRINELNHWLFNFAPSRLIGRYIYDWQQRRHQLRTQSTSTKFFRNLQQLAALEGPLANLTKTGNLSVLVAGCSYGCEAYSLGGFLALRFPRLNWRITAVDISHSVDFLAWTHLRTQVVRAHWGVENGAHLKTARIIKREPPSFKNLPSKRLDHL